MIAMKIMLNLAFTDMDPLPLDAVRSRLVEYVLDGMNAVVAFTSTATEIRVSIPDPDFEAQDGDQQILAWQDRAYTELS